MRKYKLLYVVIELISIITSIIFREKLLCLEVIFLYKYLIIVLFLVFLNLRKKEFNELMMKYIFFINLILVSVYYILNLIIFN